MVRALLSMALFVVPCISMAGAPPRLVLQQGHHDAIEDIALSPDGKRLATASQDATVRIWEASSGRLLRTLDLGAGNDVWSVLWWSDRRLATAHGDSAWRLWDVATGEVLDGAATYAGNLSGLARLGPMLLAESEGMTRDNSFLFGWPIEGGRAFRSEGEWLASPSGVRLLDGPHGDDRAFELADTLSGDLIHRFSPATGVPETPVTAGAFSEDGLGVLLQFWDGRLVWWTPQGARDLGVQAEPVVALDLAPGGDAALILEEDGGRWITAEGEETALPPLEEGAVRGEAWIVEAGPRALVTAADGSSAVRDLRTGEVVVPLVAPSAWFIEPFVAWRAARGQAPIDEARLLARLLTGWAMKRRYIERLTTGEGAVPLPGATWHASLSRDRRVVFGYRRDALGGWWLDRFDTGTGAPLGSRRLVSVDGIAHMEEVGGETWIGEEGGTVLRYSAGPEPQRYTGAAQRDPGAIRFDASGHLLVPGWGQTWDLTGSGAPIGADVVPERAVPRARADGSDAVVVAEDGAELTRFAGHGPPRWPDHEETTDLVTGVALAADGRGASVSTDYTGRIWDPSGTELTRLVGHRSAVRAVAWSLDASRVATGGDDQTARTWDAATGEALAVCVGHTRPVHDAAWHPDGRLLATAGGDGEVRLWRVDEGCRPLARLIAFGDSWAVVDPDSRFDASNGGDVDGLHWVYAGEAFELGQLAQRYYTPHLLPRLLGHGEPPPAVDRLGALPLQPSAELVTRDDGRLSIRLEDRGGGIGKVVVRLNGREVIADARPRGVRDADKKAVTVELSLDALPMVPGATNRLEIVPWNGDEWLSGRSLVAQVQAPGVANQAPPRLYALVVGVSDYLGDALDLRFASDDADAFGAALGEGAAMLFGEGRVDLEVLSSTGRAPTARHVREWLDRAAAESHAEDVVLVYLAGHGVAQDGDDGDFLYLLRDATDLAALRDPEVRERASISGTELAERLGSLPALKQVLILDTCHSGKAVELLSAARQVPGSRARALQRMKDRVGLHILAGSAADAVSYEASRFGHGVLTWSLLDGMRGAALDAEGLWGVSNLFEHATREVPGLAADIGGVQRPVVATPRGGSSFAVGIATPEVRARIVLSSRRPWLERVTVVDGRLRDPLELAAAAAGHLMSRADDSDARFAYVDQPALGEYALTGRYAGGGPVEVELVLYDGDEEVARGTLTAEDADRLGAAMAAWAETQMERASP